MNTRAKKAGWISISSFVGIAALINFSMQFQFPLVLASDFEVYKIKSQNQFDSISSSLNTIQVMQLEAEIVRIQEKIENGTADREDRTRFMEKVRIKDAIVKRIN